MSTAPTTFDPVRLRGGAVTLDPRLDRIPLFDDASRDYTIRELLADGHASLRRAGVGTGRATANRYWLPGPTLDQNQEGQCVSEAVHDAHNGSPDRARPQVTVFEQRRDAYHQMQHLDPWDGCYLGPRCPLAPSPESYGGTATLTGMQWGKQQGYWREYRWIGAGSGKLEDDIIDTLSGVGGIVFGVAWLEGMYRTNPDGLVKIEGRQVGAHAIHGFEWIPKLRLPKSFKGTKPAIAWHNSWGDDYGIRRRGRTGVGFVLLDELLELLDSDGYKGEGAVPLA